MFIKLTDVNTGYAVQINSHYIAGYVDLTPTGENATLLSIYGEKEPILVKESVEYINEKLGVK